MVEEEINLKLFDDVEDGELVVEIDWMKNFMNGIRSRCRWWDVWDIGV